MTSPIALPETGEIRDHTGDLIGKARHLEVTDQDTLDSGGILVKGIQSLRRQIKDTFDVPKRKAHEAHRAICDAEKKHDAPLAQAEMTLKNSIGGYVRKEEERRRHEHLVRQAASRRVEEDSRLQQAELLESAGEREAAENLLEEEPPPPPPPTAKETRPKTENISTREVWSAEVYDLRALCKWIGGGGAMNLVEPNVSALNALARAQKNELATPGVRAVSKTVVAGRS